MKVLEFSIDDYSVEEHVLDVPLNWVASGISEGEVAANTAPGASSGETIDIFARVITPKGGENYPYAVFMQGGPGSYSPRPVGITSWHKTVLERYRLVMFDQRGTGRSHGLDRERILSRGNATDQARFMRCFATDSIVRDAEAFRTYLGIDKWTLIGQSYGGFINTEYLSIAPEGLAGSIVFGGLQVTTDEHGKEKNIDDLYRATYRIVAKRCQDYYNTFPEDEAMIRRVCAHVDAAEEYLPSGEKLISKRVREVGICLGRKYGFETLHYLFEQPFSGSCLGRRFLYNLYQILSFEDNPLYALMHEYIYALPGQATNWSADRMRAEVMGMEADANPHDKSQPYYLTGEHIFRSTFDSDPALVDLGECADILAQVTDASRKYDLDVLANNTVPCVALAYTQDNFVPYEFSKVTAKNIQGLQLVTDTENQHDGIRQIDADTFRKLMDAVIP